MSADLNQISGYFGRMPMWLLVMLAVIVLIAAGYELFTRKTDASAADNFRTAILAELAGLYPEPINWPQNIDTYLSARLPAMQEAFMDFRPHVPQERLPSYNRAWGQLSQFCRAEINDAKCAAAALNPGNEPDPKKVFHELVSSLLRHAHPD